MGCPPLVCGLEEGGRRENPRHARNITTAATMAEIIDTYNTLSYSDPERREEGGRRVHACESRQQRYSVLTWSAIFG